MVPARVLVCTEPSKPVSGRSLGPCMASNTAGVGVTKPTPQPWSTKTWLSGGPRGGAGKPAQTSTGEGLAKAPTCTGGGGEAWNASGEVEAKAVGADYVGLDEYLDKIKGGWTDVDVIITMPSVMGKLGPLGRILGPRGLMPNPKTGTVTMDVAKAVSDVKAGKSTS